jgi:hypothetical protein
MKQRPGFIDNATQQKHKNLSALMLAIEHYGGFDPKCACCREAIPSFLTIDHVNNDGAKLRLEWGGRPDWGGHHLARKLKQKGWPSGYQILCMNCNLGRHKNGGICPHKLPVKTLREQLAELDRLRKGSPGQQAQLFQSNTSAN